MWTVCLMEGIVGAAIGSFLNVCIYRWPAEQSVVRPRSRCPSCQQQLAWRDNIPIVSWLLLGGKCRYCGTRISAQYPLVELATALLWIAAVMRFGVEIEALRSAIFFTILLGIAMTDAREMVIPDQFTVIGAAIGLAFAPLPGGITIVSALIGAGGGYVLLWIVKLVAEKVLGKPALGVGDIHMMLLVGAFLGITGVLLTIMLGSVLGLVLGIPLTRLRTRGAILGTYLPLGTFLALGAAISHAWGDAIFTWYLALLGT
jgi:leader peptidase (prepilin peptidase)/N-methyltransferase